MVESTQALQMSHEGLDGEVESFITKNGINNSLIL
jgi:hypothetical protein